MPRLSDLHTFGTVQMVISVFDRHYRLRADVVLFPSEIGRAEAIGQLELDVSGGSFKGFSLRTTGISFPSLNFKVGTGAIFNRIRSTRLS